jgi:hypothetical protein
MHAVVVLLPHFMDPADSEGSRLLRDGAFQESLAVEPPARAQLLLLGLTLLLNLGHRDQDARRPAARSQYPG